MFFKEFKIIESEITNSIKKFAFFLNFFLRMRPPRIEGLY